jgi:hypothetical protein
MEHLDSIDKRLPHRCRYEASRNIDPLYSRKIHSARVGTGNTTALPYSGEGTARGDHWTGAGVNAISPPGLLYLENSYVVPGGRFNEMYGWDSYFILRGLLEENRIALARGMVENFFFEIVITEPC